MDESKLDRQKEEQLRKEEARQNSETIARCYGDIKRGVAMVQDAADSGTKILNSHLLNLLEEPLEKLQKLIECIDPIEYSDNLVKQKGYLVSSLDKLDASLKERVDGIIKQFDSLIDRLTSDIEKHEMLLDLLEKILSSGPKYTFSVKECLEKGIDFNELVDCKLLKLSKQYESMEKVSAFGACLRMHYPKEFIASLLDVGADIGKVCEILIGEEKDQSVFHRKNYPLWFLCIKYSCFNDASFLNDLLKCGLNLNGVSSEWCYDNPDCYDCKSGVLKSYLIDVMGKSNDAETVKEIKLMQDAGLNVNNGLNANMNYSDTGEKYTITDWLLRNHPSKREIHKLFIGCKYDKSPLLKEVCRAKIYGSYNGYLNNKNYLLFLINNGIDALSDFSYRLSYSDGDSSFTGSLIGLLAYDIYDSRQDGNDIYIKIRSDFRELLTKLEINLDWVAVKNKNGSETSFRQIINGR